MRQMVNDCTSGLAFDPPVTLLHRFRDGPLTLAGLAVDVQGNLKTRAGSLLLVGQLPLSAEIIRVASVQTPEVLTLSDMEGMLLAV